MNQILVTKKLYITPELKRKKKVYKFHFILSIFLVVILISFYVYAEYDRNKSEEVSQELLESFANAETDDTVIKDDILVIYLNDTVDTGEVEEIDNSNETNNKAVVEYTASTGEKYTVIGRVRIPKINVDYPIISYCTDGLLKIAPCKFWGADPNEVGNLCIAGHNYRNSKFFSKVPKLIGVGDIIEITDLLDRTLQYEVYDKYTVSPEDASATTQLTNGRKEITLVTCTDDSKLRVIVKAKEVK